MSFNNSCVRDMKHFLDTNILDAFIGPCVLKLNGSERGKLNISQSY